MNTKEAEKFIMARKKKSGATPSRHQCYIAGHDAGFEQAKSMFDSSIVNHNKKLDEASERVLRMKLFIAKVMNTYHVDECFKAELRTL